MIVSFQGNGFSIVYEQGRTKTILNFPAGKYRANSLTQELQALLRYFFGENHLSLKPIGYQGLGILKKLILRVSSSSWYGIRQNSALDSCECRLLVGNAHPTSCYEINHLRRVTPLGILQLRSNPSPLYSALNERGKV
jgi:hypothetical protein